MPTRASYVGPVHTNKRSFVLFCIFENRQHRNILFVCLLFAVKFLGIAITWQFGGEMAHPAHRISVVGGNQQGEDEKGVGGETPTPEAQD